MSALDRIVAWISPEAAVRRAAARHVLAGYEAAQPSRVRKTRRGNQSINEIVARDGGHIRAHVRWLERNHDLARGALRLLVNNTVGPAGIGIEPQPRRADGTIDTEYARKLREAWFDWQRMPEVTGRLSWSKTQRLVARTWFRDGECFAQELLGNVQFLSHGTRVPYSLELMEPDMIPVDFSDAQRGIAQGIERDAWGRCRAFWVYKTDPREHWRLASYSDLKRVPAERVLQVATIDRIGQLRGVSEFASVVNRLDDIKDYEESERVAAKIAARLTAYIKKGSPDMYDPNLDKTGTAADGSPEPREMRLEAGMIVDGLGVGEEVGLIDSKRPNPNLITFRQGQLRAVAAGIGASYSSVSKDYDGTYSAQRQELVEQWVHYATLTDEFTGMFVRPVWESFVRAADLSGVVPIPADVPRDLADDALFVGQSMPWIDPVKEANAWETLVRAGFASEVEVMRRRGVNPRDVLEQMTEWRREVKEHGLVLSSDAAHDSAAAPDPAEPDDDQPPARASAKRKPK